MSSDNIVTQETQRLVLKTLVQFNRQSILMILAEKTQKIQKGDQNLFQDFIRVFECGLKSNVSEKKTTRIKHQKYLRVKRNQLICTTKH